LKNLEFSILKLSVLGPMKPNGLAFSRYSSVLLVLPIMRALSILVVFSPCISVKENSIPARRLSATLKLWNLTSPTLSAIAPFLPFFQEVKFQNSAVIAGFYQNGSVELLGS